MRKIWLSSAAARCFGHVVELLKPLLCSRQLLCRIRLGFLLQLVDHRLKVATL